MTEPPSSRTEPAPPGNSFLAGAGGFLSDLAASARDLPGGFVAPRRPSGLRPRPALLASEARWLWALLGLAILFHQAYFWTGRALFRQAGPTIAETSDALYGWDIPRVVLDLTERGENRRSNVHPLFVVWGKPLGLFFRHVVGLAPYTSALAAAALAAALGVAMMALLARMLGAQGPEATLAAAVYGATTTHAFLGSIPETGAFSILSVLFVYLLGAHALSHAGASPLLWIASGVFSYGNAVTNVLKNAFGFFLTEPARGGARGLLGRTAAYLTVVVTLGLGLSLAVGSSLDMWRDRWVAMPSQRGTDLEDLPTHMLRSFFLYSFVAPTPRLAWADLTIAGVRKTGPIVNFNDARYERGPGLLALAWALALALGVGLALRRGQPAEIRALGLVAACLAWDFLFFSRYYVPIEGVFVWSPHYVVSVFVPFLFVAAAISRLPPRPRLAADALLALFLIGQAANNLSAILESGRLLK